MAHRGVRRRAVLMVAKGQEIHSSIFGVFHVFSQLIMLRTQISQISQKIF
jgi:hypothetical protein